MTWLQYEVVDVFTDRPFAGNPLAVVLDADDCTTEQLQQLANEFSLSETAFPLRAEDGADYRLRIFTPETELPFAGHPSVGAAWVLRRLGRIGDGRVVQSCGAGLLPLDVGPDEVVLTAGEPQVGEPVNPTAFLAAARLTAADVAGEVRQAGCGIDFWYLPVHADALERVAADLGAVRALGTTGLSVVAWDGTTARCRVFAAGAGVGEDPATGSAAAGLGAWAAASGLVGDGTTAYDVAQGVEMGRPSALRCEVDVEGGRAVRVRVGGRVVPVAEGRVRVP